VLGPSTRHALAGFALLAYVLWLRTHGIAEGFWLRGDQIRDWAIALRDLTDLPLSGVPSTAGGPRPRLAIELPTDVDVAWLCSLMQR
jgi:hypothetical protein